ESSKWYLEESDGKVQVTAIRRIESRDCMSECSSGTGAERFVLTFPDAQTGMEFQVPSERAKARICWYKIPSDKDHEDDHKMSLNNQGSRTFTNATDPEDRAGSSASEERAVTNLCMPQDQRGDCLHAELARGSKEVTPHRLSCYQQKTGRSQTRYT